ncbi:MAG: hypothetical protein ACYTG5_01055 [Planctomycetota bacterium]|jgi:archaellum component FlaC
MASDQDQSLQKIAERLQAIEDRFTALDRCLQQQADLQRKLEESENNRRQLADQATHLLEQLSQTRKELRQYWDEDKRAQAEGKA